MSLEPHQRAGERAHHDGADGKCNVKARDGAGAQVRRIPLQDVEDDSGEKAGFRHAQQKTGGVELHRRADEHHRHGDNAPGDHNAGEPAAGAKAVEQEVGGDLAGGIAEEE
jgi:hypothetical protein